jgi:hypothetical protein
MLAVNVICRLIAVSLAAALTGCATSAFSVSGGWDIIHNGGTYGYAFTVRSPIRVTDLGVWDGGDFTTTGLPYPYATTDPGDGLAEPHAVKIWTSDATPLVQTTIPAGTSGKLIDNFRYVPIAPFILAPGTYTIGAYYTEKPESDPDRPRYYLKDRVLQIPPQKATIASASEGFLCRSEKQRWRLQFPVSP